MIKEENRMTMTYRPFMEYWLNAAFPHCHGLQRYLNEWLWLPYSQEVISQMFGTDESQEITPIHKTVVVEEQVVTILIYRYHVEYRIEGREIYKPCIPYNVVKLLDNDNFFFLLPIADMSEYFDCGQKITSDLTRRLSETDLPTEHIKDVASMLEGGLIEADGAEDEPLWVIWQETSDSLYGAECWEDELHVFKQWGKDKSEGIRPYKYIPVTMEEGEDNFLWVKHEFSQWISSLND